MICLVYLGSNKLCGACLMINDFFGLYIQPLNRFILFNCNSVGSILSAGDSGDGCVIVMAILIFSPY